MEKAYTFRASKEFLHVLERSRWVLEKPMSEIIRKAVTEYLQRHLPKSSELRKLLEELVEAKGN